MNDRGYLGTIKTTTEQVNSKIMIKVLEGSHYVKSNVQTYVEVEIPPYFTEISATSKMPPSYNKTFTIDLPPMPLEDLLCKLITITVYQKSKIPFLTKNTLGRVTIEIATIWSEPGKMFHHKWLPLIDRNHHDIGLKGYLKCDILIFCGNETVDEYRYLPRKTDKTFSKNDINQNNMFIPNGFKMAPTHIAKYSIRFHRGDMPLFLDRKGPKWLSVHFGEAPEATIAINLKNDTTQNWDSEYSTINVYPPLCPTIVIKLLLSGNIVAIKTLSMQNFMTIDGLPCFGPAYIHLTSLENTGMYIGKILISIETELVPSEVENITTLLDTENIPPIPNKVFVESKILIFGIIYNVDQILKSITRKNTISLSLNFGEYNSDTNHTKHLDLINTWTPEYEVDVLENGFYNFRIPNDIKPCLFLVTKLSDKGCQAMLAVNTFCNILAKMKVCISKCNSRENYYENTLEITKKTLTDLSLYCLEIKKTHKEDLTFRANIHESFINFMKSIYDNCLQQKNNLTTITHSDTVTSTNNEILDEIRNKLERIQDSLIQSYNGPPDIILNVWNDKKIISSCQIQLRHFLHSSEMKERGQYCGEMQSWLLTATDNTENAFDGSVKTVFWVGSYNDFDECLKNIPGIISANTSRLSKQYRFEVKETLIQCKVYISQAALTEVCYKRYGQLSLRIRVTVAGYSMQTHVINSSLSPFWNVTLMSKAFSYYSYGKAPIYAIFQLCDVQISKQKIDVEKVIGFSVLKTNTSKLNKEEKLNWFDVFDRSDKIGELFASVEVTTLNNESTETDNTQVVPMPQEVLPICRTYRLHVLFWGMRNLKLYFHELFVRMSCSEFHVNSDVINRIAIFPNFPNAVDRKFSIDVELPENPYIIPPVTFRLFSKLKLKKNYHQIGMCAPQPAHRFLTPLISEAEWSILQKERPINTVVNIEENESSTTDYEDEENENQTTELTEVSTSIKYSCGRSLRNAIKSLTPFCLKRLTSILVSIMLFIYNVFSCLCPCIPSYLKWLKNKCVRFFNGFQNKYEKLPEESDDDESEYSWWSKYYASKIKEYNQRKPKRRNLMTRISCKMLPFLKRCEELERNDTQMRYSKIKSLMLYDKELEKISEFGGFEDNFRKFNIYGHNENEKSQSVIAILKANLRLQPKPLSRDELRKTRIEELFSTTAKNQNWPGLSSNAKCKVLVRVYVLRAYNLHPTDTSGSSDPYIEISFGNTHRISDHTNYVPNTLNPIFGRYFEKLISFPKCSTVTVRIMDHDMIGKNDLIGETTIDIESRFYSKHRAQCGLSRHYNRTGYNRWRDFETPSKILHRLCECNALKPPVYTTNGVLIGPKQFFITDKNASKDRQSLALHALKSWHELPVFGHHLVPEHVETRTLINPEIPNMHQGKVEMWIDMFPKSGSIPEPVNVTPPVAEALELRVIVWSVADVQLVDDNFFTGDKHSDIYITGWIPGVEEQSTDIHYRSMDGEGLFNWRFKFPFIYLKTENRMVQKSKGFFSLELEERSYLPSLHLQIWDNDHLSPDSYIGYLTLDLWNMPRGTKTPVKCSVIDDQVPRMNLFKMKKTRGWWPFVNLEKNSDTLVGKIDTELQILTKQEADRSPAGFGRDAPQPLPEPKRPTYNYFNSIFDPCTFLLKHLFNNNKAKFCSTLVCMGIVLFMLLFLYAFPDTQQKKS